MNESKKLFIVGKKPTKLRLIITMVVSFIISLVLSNFFIIMLELKGYGLIITAIIFLIQLLFYIPTVARCSEHWDISNRYLEYYSITSYFEELKYALSVFTGKEEMFSLKILLSEVKSIKIYWTTRLSVYGTIGHPIYFGITLNDSSVITFESLITNNNKEYINAINYLRDNYNINIEDSYNLIDVLGDSNRNIVNYIDNIEKERKRSGDIKND